MKQIKIVNSQQQEEEQTKINKNGLNLVNNLINGAGYKKLIFIFDYYYIFQRICVMLKENQNFNLPNNNINDTEFVLKRDELLICLLEIRETLTQNIKVISQINLIFWQQQVTKFRSQLIDLITEILRYINKIESELNRVNIRSMLQLQKTFTVANNLINSSEKNLKAQECNNNLKIMIGIINCVIGGILYNKSKQKMQKILSIITGYASYQASKFLLKLFQQWWNKESTFQMFIDTIQQMKTLLKQLKRAYKDIKLLI